ncbi:outer membrane protein assembly factor BamD [Thioalbus denitrificans]|uniref:Outer membrane protein assembly factor BamD n=1 Tax=Thioalbus denitrificans TaxID=547122 RepID=A0A369CB56_9GAMM|nr:outer membrane protein assembly factor BamD [Thioalbus denitrificans]RCX29867.1 Beta-barrel assembly machine subunit BamD [Thioalbus denitrificans]
MRITTLLLLLTLLLTGGCSLLPDKIDETKDWSADRLYSEAKSALDEGDYENAIRFYELLEARFPFGRYAQQAQLEIIYAYYKYDESASAVAAADRFIKLHPRHPNVDYAYYMKGLANFNMGRGLIERYLPRDESQRDPGAARQSFQDFSDLVLRFPDSKYAADARQRMLFLRNNLAQYELNVADYYMRRGAYVAAANRARYVVENYPRTPATPDALAMLARAYRAMDMDDLAADALRVLKLNYPEHPALRAAAAR